MCPDALTLTETGAHAGATAEQRRHPRPSFLPRIPSRFLSPSVDTLRFCVGGCDTPWHARRECAAHAPTRTHVRTHLCHPRSAEKTEPRIAVCTRSRGAKRRVRGPQHGARHAAAAQGGGGGEPVPVPTSVPVPTPVPVPLSPSQRTCSVSITARNVSSPEGADDARSRSAGRRPHRLHVPSSRLCFGASGIYRAPAPPTRLLTGSGHPCGIGSLRKRGPSLASGGCGRHGQGRAVAAHGVQRGAEGPTLEAVGPGRHGRLSSVSQPREHKAGTEGGVRGRDSRCSATCVRRPARTRAGGPRGAGRRCPEAGRAPYPSFLTRGMDTHHPCSPWVSAGGKGPTRLWLPELTPRAGHPHLLTAKTGLGLAHALGRPMRPWSACAALRHALVHLRLRVTRHETCRRPALPKSPGWAPAWLAVPRHRWEPLALSVPLHRGRTPGLNHVRPGRCRGHHRSLPIVTRVSSPHWTTAVSLTAALSPESPLWAVETEGGRGDADMVSSPCHAGHRVWSGLTHADDAADRTGGTQGSSLLRAGCVSNSASRFFSRPLQIGSELPPGNGRGDESEGHLLGSWGQQGAPRGGMGPRSSSVTSSLLCCCRLNTVTLSERAVCSLFYSLSLWNLEFLVTQEALTFAVCRIPRTRCGSARSPQSAKNLR